MSRFQLFIAKLYCYILPLAASFLITITTTSATAQKWSVSNKITQIGWKSMVYVESIHRSPQMFSNEKDTTSGTGFLISDSDEIYLVTAMSNIQTKSLIGVQKLADSIYISASPDGTGGGIYISRLQGNQNSYQSTLSLEQVDLHIIPLAKNHQPVLKYLLKTGLKPIPFRLMHTSIKDLKVGDTLFNSSYTTFRNSEGKRKRMQGMGLCFVKSFEKTANTFVMDEAFKEGGNGSVVIFNGKVIGMMTSKLGKTNNGVVLKSTYIMSSIRKLQKAALALR